MGLGEKIKTLREEKGTRQSDLAIILGVSASAVASYEQGVRVPRLETLEKLANYFGVTTSSLMGQEEGLTGLEINIQEFI